MRVSYNAQAISTLSLYLGRIHALLNDIAAVVVVVVVAVFSVCFYRRRLLLTTNNDDRAMSGSCPHWGG